MSDSPVNHRPIRIALFAIQLITLMLLVGCEILTPAVRPTIPPPERPVTTIPAETAQGELVFLAEDVVRPGRDPDIVNLLNNVSEQQLMAYVQQMQDFGTRNSYSETQREDFGIGATRRWLFSEFERIGNGRMIVEFQDFPLTFPEAPTVNERNVVATLPGVGNHPGVIVIGAHYDSRLVDEVDGTSLSPSANDNASGVAMLLETARLMSARTWNQTVVFVAFAAEEQGTAGSRYFVNDAFLDDLQIDFMINNDSIGGHQGIPQSIRLFAPQIDRSGHGVVARYMNYLNRMYQSDFPITIINAADRQGRYGDQREFQDNGISAVRLTQSVEDPTLLNSTRDTWDRIDYTYLAKSLKVNLTTLANWAGAPSPPAPPAMAPMAEEGSYMLTWAADPQAASYAVSFRPLNSLEYPEFEYVSASDAGQWVKSGLDPNVTYGVSIAPISLSGRLGAFSNEIIIP